MEHLFEEGKNELRIYLPKEVDHHSADKIRKEADKRIERNCIQTVVFDFEKTSFMDSSGIGLLMGRYKLVSYIGGAVYAVHLSPHLLRLIELAGIHKYIVLE